MDAVTNVPGPALSYFLARIWSELADTHGSEPSVFVRPHKSLL